MWKAAIEAIQQNNTEWLHKNRLIFQQFFFQQNLKPQGQLSKEALTHHYQDKLFKLFLAEDYQGLALDLHQGAKWIENASFLDGNWGWLLGIGVGGAYFADYCDEKIAQQYFSAENALVAGSGKPCDQAKPVKNGFEITGNWKYCSGSEQASFFTAVTLVDKKPQAFIIPTSLAKIKQDWNAIGLSLTCSHSIEVEKALIPKNYFFDLSQPPRKNNYPISTYSFLGFAMACFVPVITGITKSLFHDAENFLTTKKDVWQTYQPERFQLISKKIEKVKIEIEKHSDTFYQVVEKSWNNHLQQKNTLQDELMNSGQNLADYCYAEACAIIPLLGMDAIEKTAEIQKQFQDLQTAYQHMIFRSFNL